MVENPKLCPQVNGMVVIRSNTADVGRAQIQFKSTATQMPTAATQDNQ